jgi:hypothetical protein
MSCKHPVWVVTFGKQIPQKKRRVRESSTQEKMTVHESLQHTVMAVDLMIAEERTSEDTAVPLLTVVALVISTTTRDVCRLQVTS